MNLSYSKGFLKDLENAPPEIKKAFFKQCQFLASDFRHPSLRVKKYDERLGIWQARVTKGWRVYFTIEGDTYCLHTLMPHPK